MGMVMAAVDRKTTSEKTLYFIGILAWLIPGAGHWILGFRHRAAVICITICTTFLFGVILGSVEVIDPQNAKAWFCAQVLCGLPAFIVTVVQEAAVPITNIYGRGVDIGQVYAGVAGLLNLLCIMDALLRTQWSGVGDKAKTRIH